MNLQFSFDEDNAEKVTEEELNARINVFGDMVRV